LIFEHHGTNNGKPMTTPTVSTIIIFLDPGKFLEETIESVQAQTFEDWELLLVDDGSTKSGSDVARDLAARHPDRVRYLEHPGHENRGKSESRNLGFRNARGRYVALLDADDVWLPDTLREQVAILDAHPEVGMVYGNTLYWYGWSGEKSASDHDFTPALGVAPEAVHPPPTLLPKMLSGRAAEPCTGCYLARRDLVERIGAFEDEFRVLYEDQVFISKLFLAAPVYVSSRCWLHYRQHPASICATTDARPVGEAARLTFLDWLVKYLRAGAIEDEDTWRAVNRQYWIYGHYRRVDRTRPQARIAHLWRRAKKLLLRVEETLLPVRAQRWIWSRSPNR